MTDEDIGPILTAKEEGRRLDWQDICPVSYTHLIARDKEVGKDYLLCDYNRDGDSYRLV